MPKAKKIATSLRAQYGVKTSLFGSLARQDIFNYHSDLDLYLANWQDERRDWQRLGEVERLAGPFPFHLVAPSDSVPTLFEVIKKEGKEI